MIIGCGWCPILYNSHPNALSLQKIAAENIINSIENNDIFLLTLEQIVYGIYSV